MFYGESARGYPNVCRRLLFFRPGDCTSTKSFRQLLDLACGGDATAAEQLQSAFVGFTVIRPIPNTPLGRTVVDWYPDDRPNVVPRVVAPCRRYDAHLAGLRLTVKGLTWQQQDSAVAACATVGLWTMFQSSAFQDRIALPTTAGITESGHRTASFGERVFPTSGLFNHHLLEAIKEHGLAPLFLEGDEKDDFGSSAFSVARFASTCASLLRSGFPVLIIGKRGKDGHVICAVGFRPRTPPRLATGKFEEEDAQIDHLYIHDDALGANVRFALRAGEEGHAVLVPDPPDPKRPNPPVESPTLDVEEFIPREMAIAVVPELRVSPDMLHEVGLEVAKEMSTEMSGVVRPRKRRLPGVHVSLRLVRLSTYFESVLAECVAQGRPLQRARLELAEKTPPMSLYLAVVRISVEGNPMMDVLYDTTDGRRGLEPFAHTVFDADTAWLLRNATWISPFGKRIRAY